MSFPKELNELIVYKNSVKAGVLKRQNTGVIFIYDEFYLNNYNEDLSIHLPLSKKEHTLNGTNLFPFFAGLLPEGMRLKALTRKVKTSEDDMFSLLAAIGSDCIGDVSAGELSTVSSVELKAKNIDFYKLFQDNLDSSSLHPMDSSLAGVQEKISASMISFPLNIAKKNKHYILKLNPSDKPDLIENEYACLSFAKKCGIKVNQVKIVKDSKQQLGLLVERFDRTSISGDNEIKLHQEDACQFLNLFPADKYRLSFRKICEGIEKYCTAPKIEVLNAIKLYCFSYLVGNGDLHAKNISIQKQIDNSWVLTPAYDLVCTYIYKDHKMALKLNGRDDNIKAKDIIDFAQIFGVPEKSVIRMLRNLCLNYDKNFKSFVQAFNDSQIKKLTALAEKRLNDLRV